MDPTHPNDRKKFILQDSGAKFVVVMQDLLHELPEGTPHLIIQPDGSCNSPNKPSSKRKKVKPEDVCYAYYTSGSTGQPKGVIVEHRGVVNQLFHFQERFNLEPKDVVMAVTTLTFDPCICEIYWPLAFGATVKVVSTATQKRPDKLGEMLDEYKPKILQATPTLFSMLDAVSWKPSHHTNVLCGGEAFPNSLKPMMKHAKTFSNVYGPTETTVWATHFQIKCKDWDKEVKGDVFPAGRGLKNYLTLVLRKSDPKSDQPSMEPVKLGDIGELYLGGAGMTRY